MAETALNKNGKGVDPNSAAGRKLAGQTDPNSAGYDPMAAAMIRKKHKDAFYARKNKVIPGDAVGEPTTDTQGASTDASNYRTGGNLWGGGGGSGRQDPVDRMLELRKRLRYATAGRYSGLGGNERPLGTAAAYQRPTGLRLSGSMNLTRQQGSEALNRWNEFQRKRAQAMSTQLPKLPTQQGQSVASRTNMIPNQLPTLGQQVAGQTGGNLSNALMNAGESWKGPQG